MRLRALAFALALVACLGFQSQDGWGRERGGETAAAKDALEGKAPPVKLEMESWMNAPEKAPTWGDPQGQDRPPRLLGLLVRPLQSFSSEA